MKYITISLSFFISSYFNLNKILSTQRESNNTSTQRLDMRNDNSQRLSEYFNSKLFPYFNDKLV